MQNHLLDELLADYAGISCAAGFFRADWFLRFLGIHDPEAQPGERRFDIYLGDPRRGDPVLTPTASRLLERVTAWAASNLERCERSLDTEGEEELAHRGRMIQAMATLGLDPLAAPEGAGLLEGAYSELSA